MDGAGARATAVDNAADAVVGVTGCATTVTTSLDSDCETAVDDTGSVRGGRETGGGGSGSDFFFPFGCFGLFAPISCMWSSSSASL